MYIKMTHSNNNSDKDIDFTKSNDNEIFYKTQYEPTAGELMMISIINDDLMLPDKKEKEIVIVPECVNVKKIDTPNNIDNEEMNNHTRGGATNNAPINNIKLSKISTEDITTIMSQVSNEESHILPEEEKSEKEIKYLYDGFVKTENHVNYLPNTQKGQDYLNAQNAKYKNSKMPGAMAEKQHSKNDNLATGLMLDWDAMQATYKIQITIGQKKQLAIKVADIISGMFEFEDGATINIFSNKRPLPKTALGGERKDELALPYKEKDKCWKDGWHFLIPELQLTYSEKLFLIKKMGELINFPAIFNTCAFEDYNILDTATAHVPVYMYYCSKKNQDTHHEIEEIWEFEADQGGKTLDSKSKSWLTKPKTNLMTELSINTWGNEKYMEKNRGLFNNETELEFSNWKLERNNYIVECEEKKEKYKPTEEHLALVKSSEKNYKRFKFLLEVAIRALDPKFSNEKSLWLKILALLKSIQQTYDMDEDYIIGLADEFSSNCTNGSYVGMDDVISTYRSVKPYGQWGMLMYYLRFNKKACEYLKKRFALSFPNKIDYYYIANYASVVDTYEGYKKVIDLIVNCINSELCIIKGSKTFYIKRWMNYNTTKKCIEEAFQQKELKCLKQDYANQIVYVKLSNEVLKENGLTKMALKLNFLDIWIKSMKRKSYDKLTFCPETYYLKNPPKNIKNLYEGAGYPRNDDIKIPADFEQKEEFFNHIMDRVCQGNKEAYESILNRFAHQIQKPWEKMGSALVLKGQERTGKGLIIQILADIVGQDYMFQPTNSTQVFGDFNAGIAKCLMLFADEMVWGGDKDKAGTLKKLVTEKKLYINKKFMPLETLENRTNIYMNSNEDWIVPAGKTTERYEVHQVNSELVRLSKNDKKKWMEIVNAIVNIDKEVLSQFFHRRDISNYNHRIIVQTDALRQQKVLSLGKLDSWWLDCICSGQISGSELSYDGYDEEKGFDEMHKKDDIFDSYRKASGDIHMKSKVKFWMALNKIASIEESIPSKSKTRPAKIRFSNIETQKIKWCEYVNDPGWKFTEV